MERNIYLNSLEAMLLRAVPSTCNQLVIIFETPYYAGKKSSQMSSFFVSDVICIIFYSIVSGPSTKYNEK